MMNFYTYVYKRTDGTPFYVGKGHGNRIMQHLYDARGNRNSNRIAIKIIRKMLRNGEEPIIEKLIDNIDEELALFIEQEYIAKYGRIDNGTGILANLTDGGEGGSGYVVSDEKKKKTSETMKGTRGGKNNPFYGKKHNKETLAKMSASIKANPTKYWLGKKFSEEHLEKLRIQKTCPHCGKTGRGSAMNRYHFDKCRSVV